MSGGQQVVFVAGPSGSGKSTAMAALEDLSFYCVDNLPAQLIDQFLHLCRQATPPVEKVALAVDTREAQFLAEVPGVVTALRESGARTNVVYLECANPMNSGCIYSPDFQVWRWIAETNRGTEPLRWSLRGTDDTGASFGASSGSEEQSCSDTLEGNAAAL